MEASPNIVAAPARLTGGRRQSIPSTIRDIGLPRGTVETRRKRLLFRSLRRGSKESDLVIGGFALRHLEAMDETQLGRFETLLEQPDPDLLSWAIGLEPVPTAHDNDVMAMLRAYRKSLRPGDGDA